MLIALLFAVVDPLASRGFSVLPPPQKIELSAYHRAIRIPSLSCWNVSADTAAQELSYLTSSLEERLGMQPCLAATRNSINVSLVVQSGAVQVMTDRVHGNASAISLQAYSIQIGATGSVAIVGNSQAGLFYGCVTLLQLLGDRNSLSLPVGTIIDWPQMELRTIFWDCNHHLDSKAALKSALTRAAFFKVNAFVLKLNGHFQFMTEAATVAVEPYALSASDLQELRDYGAKYHVDLIPYLDAPGHISFLLKHPELAKFREYSTSNFELCLANPDAILLIKSMCAELVNATRGSKHFFLSTDEAYYVGLSNSTACNESRLAERLGGPGRVLADFLVTVAGHLHDDLGREVLFWGEYPPLLPADIPFLPPYIINAETYGPAYDAQFRRRGIRQMVYVSGQGVEPLFPNYAVPQAGEYLPRQPGPGEGVFAPPHSEGRVKQIGDKVTCADSAADLYGVLVAGWGDSGLHPETMWLGYATGAVFGWQTCTNSGYMSQQRYNLLIAAFMRIFYGTNSNMARATILLSEQAVFYAFSWDSAFSSARSPIFGDSFGPFKPPFSVNATDQTLPILPVFVNHTGMHLRPGPIGKVGAPPNPASDEMRSMLANKYLRALTELEQILLENLFIVTYNRYNIEVMLSIVKICDHNLRMITDLNSIHDDLLTASQKAGPVAKSTPKQVVNSIDSALRTACSVLSRRNDVVRNVIKTWGQTWFPRVEVANGRRHLSSVDSVKDHLPMRTVDMDYVVYREKLYPLDKWEKEIIAVRNKYVTLHSVSTDLKAPCLTNWSKNNSSNTIRQSNCTYCATYCAETVGNRC